MATLESMIKCGKINLYKLNTQSQEFMDIVSKIMKDVDNMSTTFSSEQCDEYFKLFDPYLKYLSSNDYNELKRWVYIEIWNDWMFLLPDDMDYYMCTICEIKKQTDIEENFICDSCAINGKIPLWKLNSSSQEFIDIVSKIMKDVDNMSTTFSIEKCDEYFKLFDPYLKYLSSYDYNELKNWVYKEIWDDWMILLPNEN
jgi:hypothetical protein